MHRAAAVDDTGNLVMMHGDTLCYLYGIPRFRLNWYITLTLEDGPSGKKLIKQQHDHLLAAETFVYQLPLVGKWFEQVLPRVSTSVYASAWHTICPQQHVYSADESAPDVQCICMHACMHLSLQQPGMCRSSIEQVDCEGRVFYSII